MRSARSFACYYNSNCDPKSIMFAFIERGSNLRYNNLPKIFKSFKNIYS